MNMPVLGMVIDDARKADRFHGQDVVVLHVNHCLDNSFYFCEQLKQLFYEVVFVGVPYNDKEVDQRCSFPYYFGKNKKGIYQLYQGTTCFRITDLDFTAATEILLERAITRDILPLLKKGKKLLVIEDGGYHYQVLNRMAVKYPQLRTQMLGSVEQTTSGTVKCVDFGRTYGFSYPCTSIARSNIKMHVESRFIGHRVVEELSSFLYTANTFLDFHNVLILGYGIVGRRVARELKEKRCQITVYDTDEYISMIAKAEGFRVVSIVKPDFFNKSTIIIGNVGWPSFTEGMLLAFLKGKTQTLYLASSSSQDREFKYFINIISEKAPLLKGLEIKGEISQKYYTAYQLGYHGIEKTIYLIAQGMPVNFYRKDAISLTYSIIDLIFSEMLSMGIALCQESSLPHRLYLLGEDDGFLPFMEEADLARLWFSKYDLSCGEDIGKILDPHPGSDYLRNKLIQGD